MRFPLTQRQIFPHFLFKTCRSLRVTRPPAVFAAVLFWRDVKKGLYTHPQPLDERKATEASHLTWIAV